MNPLTTLRHQLSLTQTDLANLSGVTRQIVIDAEIGMFSRAQPSITRYLCARTGSPVERVQANYLQFQADQRKKNLHLLIVDLSRVETFEDYAVAVGGSTRGFCRVVLVQSSVVRGYVSSGARWSGIRDVLLQAGVPGSFVTMLGELPHA